MPPIIFTDDDFHGLDHQQDDPMVITLEIVNYAVKKVLVDQGSSVDILYWATYQKLQLLDTAMVPYDEPFFSFSGEQVSTCGYISFTLCFAMEPKPKPFPSASLSSTHPHPTMSSWAVLRSTPSALSSPPPIRP